MEVFNIFTLPMQWEPSGDKKEEQIEPPEGFRWKWRAATNLEGVKKGVTVGPSRRFMNT